MAIKNHPEQYQRNCLHTDNIRGDVGIFFLFRYVHFIMMWSTFLMEKFVA